MRIGIVGCGSNSDYHINFSRSYKGAVIVGVADSNIDKARACGEKFGIKGVYETVDELVRQKKPDVLHIIVPPAKHYELAMAGISSGCHVLIEKPMAFSAEKAEELYVAADHAGAKICPIHNHYFDPCMMRAREAVDQGMAGDIVGVESYYGLNTRIDAFRRYPVPNVLPWLYSLPGGVYHDFLPHPLYVMLPFIGQCEAFQVMEKSHGALPYGMSDEVRVLMKGTNSLGTLTLSFAAEPHLHYLRIHGTRMMIHVDFNTMTTTLHPVSSLPKAAQKAIYNLGESLQLTSRTIGNVWGFLRGSVKPYQGMERLIHLFYDSVAGKAPVPVSRTAALQVVEATHTILRGIKNNSIAASPVVPLDLLRTEGAKARVLVTGASGFLGKNLVDGLMKAGYEVRALVRRLSDTRRLEELHAEIVFGDVADDDSLKAAFQGVAMVVHAAADTAGDEREGPISTVRGTANVLRLCRELKIEKLVYISSCNVYEIESLKGGSVISEDSPLERFPERRGAYTEAKLAAEDLVRQAVERKEVRAVCLRPGTIFGPGGPVFTPMMGFSIGRKAFLMIGNGRFVLPLVHVDNLVQAILTAIESEGATGRTYNVVDPYRITKREYADLLLKRLYPDAHCVYVPYLLVRSAVSLQQLLCRLLKRSPILTGYRLESSQKSVLYDSSRIMGEVGWLPSITMEGAVEEIAAYEKGRNTAPGFGASARAPAMGDSQETGTRVLGSSERGSGCVSPTELGQPIPAPSP